MHELIVQDNSFNTIALESLQFNHSSLIYVEIGNSCFANVKNMEIKDCNSLEVLLIGQSCFTGIEYSQNSTFLLSDCNQLKKCDIGKDCCYYYNRLIFQSS